MKLIKSKLNRVRGFTLLELVIVIAIIGILSVIILPNFTTALAKARDATRISELNGLKTSLLLYSTENNGYFPEGGYDASATACKGFGCILGKKIDSKIPLKTNTVTGQNSPEKYNYVGLDCTVGTGCVSYQIWTQLETKNQALDNDADVVDSTNAISRGLLPNTSAIVQSTIKDGSSETCPTRLPTGSSCLFDLTP